MSPEVYWENWVELLNWWAICSTKAMWILYQQLVVSSCTRQQHEAERVRWVDPIKTPRRQFSFPWLSDRWCCTATWSTGVQHALADAALWVSLGFSRRGKPGRMELGEQSWIAPESDGVRPFSLWGWQMRLPWKWSSLVLFASVRPHLFIRWGRESQGVTQLNLFVLLEC